ncbi:MAG: hypothetical protein OXL97_02670 [Chloroflexota bacterium]|nr:hypothetical protein [Chloroflexota bacterium]MDE2884463.1 hypothetical protein [Chloroflexota bacterium]
MYGREWKSQAAEQIKLNGNQGSEELLFGPGKKQRPMDEMTPSQLRKESERRAARPKAKAARPRSLLGRFRARLGL